MPLPFVFHASYGHLRNDVKKSTPATPSAFCRQHHLGGSGLDPAPAASSHPPTPRTLPTSDRRSRAETRTPTKHGTQPEEGRQEGQA